MALRQQQTSGAGTSALPQTIELEHAQESILDAIVSRTVTPLEQILAASESPMGSLLATMEVSRVERTRVQVTVETTVEVETRLWVVQCANHHCPIADGICVVSHVQCPVEVVEVKG